MDHNSRKTFWILPVAAVATALLLTACSGGSSNKGSGAKPGVSTVKPVVSTSQAQHNARNAWTAAKTETTNAVKVASEAVEAAATAVTETTKALAKARAARTDVDAAQKAKDAADAAKTKADAAKTKADAAAADVAALNDDDIGTKQGAADLKEGADAAKTKADAAAGDAEDATTSANEAETGAEEAAMTHVLALFKSANAYGVTAAATNDKTAAEATAEARANTKKQIGEKIATAANNQGVVSGTAEWPVDTPDDPATKAADESKPGKLSVKIIGLVADFMSDTEGTDANKDGDTLDDGDTPPNAKKIAGLGVFQNGFDIWADDRRVIVFTDKVQGKPAVKAVTSVTEMSVTRIDAAIEGKVTDLGTRSGNTYTGVKFVKNENGGAGDDTAPLTGTLICPAGEACTATENDNGGDVKVLGYQFTGSRLARKAVAEVDPTESDDYLLFGIWLDAGDAGEQKFGAFADGGQTVNVQNLVTGTATYSGKAAGAHHKTGEGVNWFDGDASLTAEFGDKPASGADHVAGTIKGEINNIRVNGGTARSDSIKLIEAGLTHDSAAFNGAAVMGAQKAPGSASHEYNGKWSGSFYGSTADDSKTTDVDESLVAPKAVAGTFGVTKTAGTGDSAVTESFVGAFGAHK